MRYLHKTIITAIVVCFALPAAADRYSRSYGNGPDIEVWTNKGYDATYYYGEDIAVYFRADRDCYAVVYDIDPSGEITILFPSNYYNSAYVRGGEVYRIPDYYGDYTLEISGRSGTEHIFAVASHNYLNPPDFIRYIGYEYGDPEYYDSDYFVTNMRGDIDDFVFYVNSRIAREDYSVDHTRFYVDSAYRHHRQYRYWDYDPYYVGSVWIGCNFPGAEIWIDGIYFGIAPILVPRIYIGEHWLWIYYGGYPCYQRYFHVSGTQRYYIDARIDDGFKDYRRRRSSFGEWRPLEKKYRNEGDFREKAIRSQGEKRVRSRTLPTHVIRDFEKRGIISADSPLAKKVRAESPREDRVRALEQRRTRQEIEAREIERRRVESEKRPTSTDPPSERIRDDSKKISREDIDTRYIPVVPKSPSDTDRDRKSVRKEAEKERKSPESIGQNDDKSSKSSGSGLKKSSQSSKRSSAKSTQRSTKKSSRRESNR